MPRGVYHRSAKLREKLSQILKDRHARKEECFKALEPYHFKKGLVPWNKGSKGTQIAWNKGNFLSLKYSAIHNWIRTTYGKADQFPCALCKLLNAKRMEWANKSGKYLRKLSDWMPLCKRCHNNYDRKDGKAKK